MILTNSEMINHRDVFARWWGFTLFIQTVSSWWWLILSASPQSQPLAVLELGVAVAGIMLFFSPQRQPLLPTAACIHLINLLWQFPDVPNHRLLSGCVDAAILAFGGLTAVSLERRWSEFCATLRIVLVAVYAFAVLHKLNFDFLFGQQSCGQVYASETAAFLGFSFRPAIAALLPWLAILTEATIPILLLQRRLAWYGVMLALTFHAVLLLHPTKHFVDFTSVIFAAMVPLLPLQRRTPLFHSNLGTVTFALGVMSVFLLQLLMIDLGGIQAAYLVQWLLFVFVAAWLLSNVDRPRSVQTALWPRSSAGILIVAFAALNGATPYLGIKTKCSWDMYANLRLEEHVSNHLFMPASLDLFGEMGELTRIQSSNIPELEALRAEGWRVPRLELDRIVRLSTNPAVNYFWRDRYWQIRDGQLTPDGYESSYLKRKLLWFRPMVAPEIAVPCGR